MCMSMNVFVRVHEYVSMSVYYDFMSNHLPSLVWHKTRSMGQPVRVKLC